DVLDAGGYGAKNDLHLAAEQIGNVTAAIWNVNQVDTSHHDEPFAEDVGDGPAAGRPHVDLTRIGLGIGDELRDRCGCNGWIDHHDVRGAPNAGDGRYFADEIEIELLVERRVHRVRQPDKQERIAVRRCPDDAFGADIATGARSVLNDE